MKGSAFIANKNNKFWLNSTMKSYFKYIIQISIETIRKLQEYILNSVDYIVFSNTRNSSRRESK